MDKPALRFNLLLAFLFLSLAFVRAYFAVYPTSNDWDMTYNPDLKFWTTGSIFLFEGHELSLLVIQSLSWLSLYLPIIFIGTFYAGSIYYLTKPYIRFPQVAFFLTTFYGINIVLAQTFSMGIFFFVLAFYLRSKNDSRYAWLIPIGLTGMMLAHIWTGLIYLLMFTTYLALDNYNGKKRYLFGFAVPLFLVGLSQFNWQMFLAAGEGMTIPISLAFNPAGLLNLALKANLGIFFSFLVSFLLLDKAKEKSLRKANLLFFVLPLLLLLFTNAYWNDRTLFIMPLIVGSTITISKLHEQGYLIPSRRQP